MIDGKTLISMSAKSTENTVEAAAASGGARLTVGQAGSIAALSVFCVSLLLYLFTLAPTVTLVDSGELILAARGLGVAHPPGFPLYILLAHASSYVPVGNIAVRIHLASALFGALAAAVMTLAVIEIMRAAAPKISGKALKSAAGESEDRVLIVGPAVLAGLLFAFSRTLWAYATIAEVYTLNTLLIITVIWLVFGWRRGRLKSRDDQAEPGDRKLYIAAFVFGLGLCVHHVTVALMLPALAVIVLSTEGKRFLLSKRLVFATVSCLAGLSIYLYLPIAASGSPLMNWGDPDTLHRFIWHVTGRQYQTFFAFSFPEIREFIRLASREFGFPWLPLASVVVATGFVAVYRDARTVFWFLLLIVVADLVYCLSYQIAEDKDAYFLPAFVAMTIAAGFGFRWIIATMSRLHGLLTPIRLVITLAMVPLLAVVANFKYDNRSGYFVAHDYVENIFRSVEPGGMLLTGDWQVYSPSLYFNHVEHRREDAIVIDLNQLRRSWYYEYLDRVYPALTGQAREKIDAFLADLRQWESDPGSFDKDASSTSRINRHFYEMIEALVARQIKQAPVYVTADLVMDRGGENVELARALTAKYKLVPQGLVFRLVPKDGPDDLGEPQLLIRGIGDGTLAFDDDDVVKAKVIPVYMNMAVSSGLYLASIGKHERAIARFRQALMIDPGFEPARSGLIASQNALRQTRK